MFPEALPVSARRDEIAAAIRDHQVVIVSGETGSGKTTQLPKICLSLGRGLGAGGRGLIGHTQPRRLAATATARRIAAELDSPLGDIVGYKIRFNDRLAPGASVKLMTDGILLAETQGDPLLSAYDTIIIDEAHERSLNIDFLLGYLRQILPRRPDLKLVVTSATIDAARFAEHFAFDGKAVPVIEVSGRLYPVEVRYRPIASDEPSPKKAEASRRGEPVAIDERGVVEAIVDAVDELARIGSGDVLVFLPGEREIREAAAVLRGHHPPHTEILPLFARLSAEEQERVFKPSNARRIVLATNVAETSLTVPGIRYVVDTGLARVKRYSYRNKVEQLRTEPISRAAANQRAGRCGRVAAGVCIRLYDELGFDGRPAFTEPEILRSSLAAVILRMKTLGLGEVEAFPFLEPPLPRAINDGYQLLAELGAIDDDQRLTTIGHELGRLPLDPRIARMIVADLGGLGVIDRLDGLRHDPIICRHHEHHDIRDLGAACPHGRERGMAGRVDEGYGPAVRRRNLIGPDMLGDAAGFARHDVGLSYGIEQRRLAVIDVAHDGHDGRAGDEVHIFVGLVEEAFFDIGFGNAAHRMTEFFGDQLRHIGVDHVGDLGHVALLHQQLNHIDGAFRHAARQFLNRDGLGKHHLALQLLLRLVGAEPLHALRAAAEGCDGPGTVLLLGRGAGHGQATTVLLRTAARRPRHDEAGRGCHQGASHDRRQAAFAAGRPSRTGGRGTTGLAGRQPALGLVLGLALGFGLMGATCVFVALARFGSIALKRIARFALETELRIRLGAAAVFLLAGLGADQRAGSRVTLFVGEGAQNDAGLRPIRRRPRWRSTAAGGGCSGRRGPASCTLRSGTARYRSPGACLLLRRA